MAHIEWEYIQRLLPEYNKQHNGSDPKNRYQRKYRKVSDSFES